MIKNINIIEIDIRDADYQSGIAKYFDVLGANMPKNINTFKIIFYHSVNIKDICIQEIDGELQIFHPNAYPYHLLFESALHMIYGKVAAMENLIVKSNCLGMESLLYLFRTRFFCKTIGVLHCTPHRSLGFAGFAPNNPFFNMDHVIVVSNDGKEYLAGVKNKRPFSVIYNGIDKPIIKNKKTKDGIFRFVFANGLALHKGFAKIIPAIKKVSEKHKIEVILMGGFRDNEPIIQELQGLPIIKTGLLTNQEEINKYYEMADCALFASNSEACSFAGIEAMAYNLPIISTDAVGLAEMFGPGGALYVKLNDKYEINPDDYANQMIKIITQPRLRTKLGIFAYSRYVSNYTAKSMAKKHIDIYKKILGT